MNAMILSAGRGERLRPLTDTCPKPLLRVKGKPLIVYHLEALNRAGFESVVINISWLADQIQQALGDGSQFGLSIVYSYEAEALETAGGIVQALDLLDDTFVVVNADVYCDYDFSKLLQEQGDNHLVMVPNPAHNPQGDFSIEQGYLSNTHQQRLTFGGIARYRKSFFKDLSKGKRPLAPLLRAAADNQEITAELFRGRWSDVGTVKRLDALNA